MCCDVTLQDFKTKNELRKKDGNSLTLELMVGIVNFLSFNLKWANLRISLIFDLFVLKNQRQWIFCQNKIAFHIKKIKKHVSLVI